MNLNNKKGQLLIVLVLVFATILTACESKSDVVAQVNDVKITKDEFYDYLVKEAGKESLDALILEKIISEEIKEQKIIISKEDVDLAVKDMETQYGGPEKLKETLVQYGIDMETIRKNIELNLSIEKLLAPYINVSEDEIAEYFEKNVDTLSQKEEVRASHILVETEEEAKAVIEKLNSGESFSDLASQLSTDTASAVNGGDLGYFGRNQMVEPFDKAAFELKVGEISEPVKSQFGYHIIKVEEKKEEKIATLEDSKEAIVKAISKEKQQATYQEWYNDMLEKYEIKNNLYNK